MANILEAAKTGWENLKAWGKLATDKPTREYAKREWVQPKVQKAVRTIKPQIQEAFWTPAAKLQRWAQQAEYTPRTEIKAWQPTSLPGQLGKGVVESYMNIPRNVLAGTTRLGGLAGQYGSALLGTGQEAPGGKEAFTRALSGVAPLAESALDVYVPGAVKGLFKASGKALVKQGIKAGALQGFGEGGIGGMAYEMGKDPRKIDWSRATEAGLIGAAAGTLLGGVIGGSGAALGQLKKKVTSAVKGLDPKIPLAKAEKQADNFIRDELGRFAGRKKKDPVFYGDLRESLGLPRDGDYRGGKIDFGAEVKTASQAIEQAGTKAKQRLQIKPGGVAGRAAIRAKGIPSDLGQTKAVVKSISDQTRPLPKTLPKREASINIDRLGLSKKEKGVLRTTIKEIKPSLEKVKGEKMGASEVLEAAKKSDILKKVVSREETLMANATLLKTRQQLVSLDKEVSRLATKGKTPALRTKMTEMIDLLRAVNAEASDRGRKLQSLSIKASDESIMKHVLKNVANAESNTAKILREAESVDWNDARSITAFYRKYIKPSTMDVLDEYRYNNMLSNPRTHMRNAFSNMIQTFITRPLTLAVGGDIKGTAKYYGGALKGLPKGVRAFVDSFQGKTTITKPDLERLPTTKLPKFMTIPTRAMEAGDKFFSAIIGGGELARGATKQKARDIAEYSLFRQGLHPEGQGHLLNKMDDLTSWTYKAPKAVRWFVPFIRTPMNFAKQWIEYSPAGLLTTLGATNQKEQVAKAIIGSGVTLMGAMFAKEGNTTWSAPTSRKEKDLFYASGRKPYSVKVGDRWVSMQYLGAHAWAFAIPAALRHAQDDRGAMDDSELKKAGAVVSSMAQMLSGQTFMSGMETFVDVLRGDVDSSVSKSLGYASGQVVPLKGLVTYINTILDPVYRKSTSFVDEMRKGIPGLSRGLEPYTTPLGEESRRESINLVTPYDITKAQQDYESLFQTKQASLRTKAKERNIREQLKEETGTAISEDKIFYSDELTGDINSIDLGKVMAMPEGNAFEKLKKQKEAFKLVGKLGNANLTTDELAESLTKLGVEYDDYEYYSIANETNDLKMAYIEDQISGVQTKQELLEYLVQGRREVNGEMLVSSGVIDDLYDDDIITYEEKKWLKSIKENKYGELGVGRTGVKKPTLTFRKAPAVKKVSVPKSKKIQLKIAGTKQAPVSLKRTIPRVRLKTT